jgi:hypothetical protein
MGFVDPLLPGFQAGKIILFLTIETSIFFTQVLENSELRVRTRMKFNPGYYEYCLCNPRLNMTQLTLEPDLDFPNTVKTAYKLVSFEHLKLTLATQQWYDDRNKQVVQTLRCLTQIAIRKHQVLGISLPTKSLPKILEQSIPRIIVYNPLIRTNHGVLVRSCTCNNV